MEMFTPEKSHITIAFLQHLYTSMQLPPIPTFPSLLGGK